MIPKVFHWIWIGPEMPGWAKENIRLFKEMNPDFCSHIHGEEVLLPAFKPAYNMIIGEHLYSRKSDLLRASILLQEGGWYFDCDFLPIRPMSEIYDNYEGFPRGCFITHGAYVKNKPWIANGIIGTEPGSAFMCRVRDAVVAHANRPSKWGTFGPNLFTDIVRGYPTMAHVGLIDDYYRLQKREESMAAYDRISKSGYSREAIVKELGYPLPYAMHVSMQDSLSI